MQRSLVHFSTDDDQGRKQPVYFTLREYYGAPAAG
jgi:hypothetical protein